MLRVVVGSDETTPPRTINVTNEAALAVLEAFIKVTTVQECISFSARQVTRMIHANIKFGFARDEMDYLKIVHAAICEARDSDIIVLELNPVVTFVDRHPVKRWYDLIMGAPHTEPNPTEIDSTPSDDDDDDHQAVEESTPTTPESVLAGISVEELIQIILAFNALTTSVRFKSYEKFWPLLAKTLAQHSFPAREIDSYISIVAALLGCDRSAQFSALEPVFALIDQLDVIKCKAMLVAPLAPVKPAAAAAPSVQTAAVQHATANEMYESLALARAHIACAMASANKFSPGASPSFNTAVLDQVTDSLARADAAVAKAERQY